MRLGLDRADFCSEYQQPINAVQAIVKWLRATAKFFSPKSLTILSAMLEVLASTAMYLEAQALITESMKRKVLLRSLQGRVCFEKTVAASSAANGSGHCVMALPTWFVREHGDKLRTLVLLRSGSSTWRVNLSISFRAPPRSSKSEVKFSGGWRTFAAANGLVIGDSLIFSLRAMSEFDVDVFHKTRGPTEPSALQAQRKWPSAFKLSRRRVSKSVECGSRNLVAERSAGRVISEIVEYGKAVARCRVNKTMQDWQGRNFFEKTLSPGAVSKAFQLTLPTRFVQHYGHKIREYVVLQSVADRKVWTMKVCVRFPDRRPQFLFDSGDWKPFIVSNGLAVGDQLTFTLVAMSKFEVLILRRSQNPEAVQGPEIRRKCFAFSPTNSLGPQHIDLTGLCRVLSSEMFPGKEPEDCDAHSVSDCSESPSDMDSHSFERWCEGTSKKVCRQAPY